MNASSVHQPSSRSHPSRVHHDCSVLPEEYERLSPDCVHATQHGYHVPFRYRFLMPVYWPVWLGLLGLLGLRLVPRPVLRLFGTVLGWWAYWLAPRQRHIARTNLRLCFPNWAERDRQRMLKRHFRLGARCLMDLGLLWVSGRRLIRTLVEIDGIEQIEACQTRHRAVILLTPHTLALEHGAAALTQHKLGVGLVRPLRNPLVEWLNYRLRGRGQTVLFTRAQGLRPVIRALQMGAFFYYLPDQDRGTKHSVFAPFFGEPKATLATLGRLAGMTDACVLPTVCRYDARLDRYRIEIKPPLSEFPSGDRNADARRMNQELEALISPDLAQYMWTLRLFRTQPSGTKRAYRRRR